jgi:hypothetical protein
MERRTPGRALPAAQPQTEFTTTNVVPSWLFRASSTSSGVLSSTNPWAVSSALMGATSISGYGIIVCLMWWQNHVQSLFRFLLRLFQSIFAEIKTDVN